jgi:tetratricopeptide (TPR) repeat protein
VYVYSAASVKALSPVHLPLLEKVVAKIDAAKWTDGPPLARLALVHHRLGKVETAKALADRATRTANRTPAEAREIAVHLGTMGRSAEAAALFEGRPLTTEDRSALAELAASARDWANAERQFRAVLAATPNDPLPAIRLAEVVSLNGRHEDARTTIEGVLKREPTNATALVAAGDIYLRAKDPVTAAARFETALKVSPNSAPARAGFIDAASAAGPQLSPVQAKLAVSYADALATGQSVDPVSACRLAWVMVQQHEVPRADKLLDRAVAAITKDTPAAVRRELAPVLALRERGRDAVRMLDGLKPEPEDSLLLAKVHASLNEFPAAVAACRAYLAAKPNDAVAESQLADLLAWSGDHDDALALYAKLRAKNPTDAKLQVRTAEALWRVNRRAEAMDLFVKLLGDAEGMPAADAVGARAAFVAAAFELDKFAPDVLDALNRARPAVLLSGDAVLMGRLAVALNRAGKAADADALFDRATGLIKPDDHETRWLFAAALNLAGRRAEATRTKPVGAPGGETARRVALFYAAAGDFRSATAVLDDALTAKPDDRSLARARGDVLSWGREHGAAVAQYKKLLETGPDADLVVRLADAHLRAGNAGDALALLLPEVKKKPAGSKAVRVRPANGRTRAAVLPRSAVRGRTGRAGVRGPRGAGAPRGRRAARVRSAVRSRGQRRPARPARAAHPRRRAGFGRAHRRRVQAVRRHRPGTGRQTPIRVPARGPQGLRRRRNRGPRVRHREPRRRGRRARARGRAQLGRQAQGGARRVHEVGRGAPGRRGTRAPRGRSAARGR